LKSFILNGKIIKNHQLLNDELEQTHLSDFERDTLTFIKCWLSDQSEFSIKTSGSTGKLKTIDFRREQMKKGTIRTLETFGLKKGDRILMCLNPRFIAGMMMIVRALEGDLELIIETPSSNPLIEFTTGNNLDFAAFTPNQIEHILNESPAKLIGIKTILIGGADLHSVLEEKLQEVKSQVFHSYAMTETLTHVALRRVNGPKKSKFFYALPGVSFKLDDRSCMIINDRLLEIEDLITNDIVKLIDDSSFIWMGRFDNVINTGGVKIQIENLEKKISQIFNEIELENNFCIIPKSDRELTQKMILLVEINQHQISEYSLLKMLKARLPKYHAPKKIILVPEILHTKTGKIDRIQNADVYLHHGK